MTLKENSGHLGGVLHELMTEGLTVAAWVSLWSAFARLIFELGSIITDIRVFRRIASREVIFKASNLAKTLHRDDTKVDRVADSGIIRHNAL